MTALQKPKLSFWQIWNMSFGFLGIQFGFALQGGFMSRIFQTLGASQDSIPALWIAAPLTGLLVQPIIGYMSDRTWSPRWGRRKPFFFIGAILSTIVLFFMPHSPVLWVAAGCLWILDASINITMEPFRALVADKLPDSQRSYGFVMQTLIIGIGTWVASNLPWLVTQMGVSNEAQPGVIPLSVKIAFAIGGVVFLASVLYTIFTTTEYPLEDLDAFKKAGFSNTDWIFLIDPKFSVIKQSLISAVPSRLRKHTKYYYIQTWPLRNLIFPIIMMRIFKFSKFGRYINFPRDKNSKRFQAKTVIIATK